MPRGKGEGITKITVKGFKSIAEECTIDIRPLTILAGANSSGKSSIMQPLLLLKQTLEAPYDPGPLLLDGPNVQFTEAAQFLSVLPEKKKTDCFQIRIETCDFATSHAVTTTYKKGRQGIQIAKMTVENKSWNQSSEHWTLYPDMPSKAIKSQTNRHILEDADAVKRSRCFLDFESQEDELTLNLTEVVEYDILDSIHIPTLRGSPERTYKLNSTGPLYPGTFENYVASLIHKWQWTRNKRLITLGDALYTLGLTGKIGTQKVSDVGVQIKVNRLSQDGTKNKDMVNIADAGFGVSQVLPVLVALIVADPGQLVYLEQPELHLHPRAQVALAQVLADAAKRGVRVVAETHSSLLLLAVQTLVAEGDLPQELVKLHWFTRREDGVTEVASADLDEAGAYGEWPEDFDDVDLKAQSRYLNAVDRIRFGKEEAS